MGAPPADGAVGTERPSAGKGDHALRPETTRPGGPATLRARACWDAGPLRAGVWSSDLEKGQSRGGGAVSARPGWLSAFCPGRVLLLPAPSAPQEPAEMRRAESVVSSSERTGRRRRRDESTGPGQCAERSPSRTALRPCAVATEGTRSQGRAPGSISAQVLLQDRGAGEVRPLLMFRTQSRLPLKAG